MLGFRSEAERRWRVSRSIQAWISAATRERECVERGAREEGSEALRVVEGVDEGFEAVEVVGESGEVGVGGGEDGVELEECLYGWGIRGVVSLYVVGGFFQSFKDLHQLWGFLTLFHPSQGKTKNTFFHGPFYTLFFFLTKNLLQFFF